MVCIQRQLDRRGHFEAEFRTIKLLALVSLVSGFKSLRRVSDALADWRKHQQLFGTGTMTGALFLQLWECFYM
jgi:hypothetical protein